MPRATSSGLYEYAEQLIVAGKAYIDSSSEAEIREGRRTVTQPGRESAFRGRSPDENLGLFWRMRAGDVPDGAHVLRAKIDDDRRALMRRYPVGGVQRGDVGQQSAGPRDSNTIDDAEGPSMTGMRAVRAKRAGTRLVSRRLTWLSGSVAVVLLGGCGDPVDPDETGGAAIAEDLLST